MPTSVSRRMSSRCSSIACFLLLFSLTPLFAQEVYLCIWRNPERTMGKIFPDAKDYKTVNRKISPAQAEAIEARLGFKLLPGQRDQFQYFEMTGEGGLPIGHVIAASQKGEYGAIEFVFGLDTNNVINGLYIQRSRERDQSFKQRAFLDLFVGRSLKDARGLAKLFTGTPTPGTTAVIQGLAKELVAFEELVVK